MEENWKQVPEKYGNYEVSNIGRIRHSVLKEIKKTRIHVTGYIYGKTIKNKKKINIKLHRVVAETFIPNPNGKPCVNHINGIKTDNRVENLEWVTYKENSEHAIKTGLLDFSKTDNTHSYTAVRQFTKKGVFIKEWESIKQAATQLNVSRSAISDVCSQRYITAGGYRWQYVNNPKHNRKVISPKYRRKTVYIYDEEFKFIKIILGVNETAKQLGLSKSTVSIACITKGGKVEKGFRFSYEEL